MRARLVRADGTEAGFIDAEGTEVTHEGVRYQWTTMGHGQHPDIPMTFNEITDTP